MKLLVLGPKQSAQAQSPEGQAREAMQANAVEQYAVLTPHKNEGKLRAVLRMLRESKQVEFDTVSSQDPFFVGLLSLYIAWRADARFNVQVHTDLSSQSFLKRLIAQIVIKHAYSVRVVSEKIKNQITHPRVHVLPIFIDIERFKKIERHPEPNLILWIGRFEEEKDPRFALEILKQIPGAKLIMLGSGNLADMLYRQSVRLNLTEQVEFPGWQDSAPFLARATIVLSTSKHESFGMSIIEALAAGVPVIAPDVGVAKEAGALIMPREFLAQGVKNSLTTSYPGQLRLNLMSKEEWLERWKETFL